MADEWYNFDSGDSSSFDTGSSTYTYTPSSTSFNPDYSLSSGTSGSSYGLQAPSSGGGGGVGLSLPSDTSYGTGYQLYGGSPSYTGGAGISAPIYGGSSSFAAPTQSYSMPTAGGSAYSISPSQVGAAVLGAGTGLRAAGGSFAPGAGSTPAAPTGQAGLTGSFGGAGVAADFGPYSGGGDYSGYTTGAGAVEPGLLDRLGTKLDSLEQWGKANPRTASALTQGIGALASAYGQRRAEKSLAEQNALQRAAMQSQQEALGKNNALAAQWNEQAAQSMNEARSLYNPQEMAIRGMAQQSAISGRREQEAYANAIKRGMSPADAAAEARRARLAGSAAATTGFMAGLDTGRRAQQGALAGAKALASPYSALPGYNPNVAEANYYANQGSLSAAGLQSLMERYLGQPTMTLEEAARRAKQAESIK